MAAIGEKRQPDEGPPLSYQVFHYQRTMGISWQDAMTTPNYIMVQHLEMMALEEKYLHKSPKKT